jgi:3-hydroxyisobutyrate dehydrogenase
MSTIQRISVLGLGAMGARFARNLSQAGFQVTVWNRNANTALRSLIPDLPVAPTPAAAAASADLVISCVTQDEASAEVWLTPRSGALAGLSEGAVAMECSTLSPSGIARLDAAFTAAGRTWVEAPVLGSLPQVEAAQLVILAAGDSTVIDRTRPALAALASRVVPMGVIGRGALAKLAINGYLAAQTAALAEILATAESHGLPREELSALLAELPQLAPALKPLLGQMVARSYPAAFPIRLVAKDLRYLEALRPHVPAESSILSATQRRFTLADTAGLGGHNLSGVLSSYPNA